MSFQYPWVISGIAEIGLETARTVAYVAGNGQSGVVTPGDLQIEEQDVPGAGVKVNPGAFVVVGTYSNQAGESYVGYNDGAYNVSVSANGSGATRYDFVWAKITDPGQSGQPGTPAVVEIVVTMNVTSTTATLTDAGISGQTGLPLARIAIPASTSTITNGMITDLRKLISHPAPIATNPNPTATVDGASYQFMFNQTGADTQMGTSWGTFPSAVTYSVAVPVWATGAQVHITTTSLKADGAADSTIEGQFRFALGSTVSQTAVFFATVKDATGSADRFDHQIASQITVPAAMRGTTQTFKLEAIKDTGSADAFSTKGTTVVAKLRFFAGTTNDWW